MLKKLVIRDAIDADHNALSEMMQALNQVENAITNDRLTDLQSAQRHLTYLLSCTKEQGGFVIIAEVDRELAGFLLALYEEEDGAYIIPEACRYGYVTDLYVDANFRRSGIASALLSDAEKRLKQAGFNRLEISALAANQAALGTYEALGYQPVSIMLAKTL